MAVTASPRLWLYLRENPPTLLVGGLEFIIGGILFTSLFRYFVRVFSALKGQNGQSLSYCDSVALSCKVVSAIFACVSCAMGIIGKLSYLRMKYTFLVLTYLSMYLFMLAYILLNLSMKSVHEIIFKSIRPSCALINRIRYFDCLHANSPTSLS